MEKEEIIKFIEEQVEKRVAERLAKEKNKLADLIENRLLYQGEFAKAYSLMNVFRDWAQNR